MEAMIESGQEWMEPLLEVRNWLAETLEPNRKRELREVRRRTGQVQVWGENNDKVVWGPYKLAFRHEILRRVLNAERLVRERGPDKNALLIQPDELHEIRRLWRATEGDWEDTLPRIYREERGEGLDWVQDDEAGNSVTDLRSLEEVAGRHGIAPRMLMELVDLERSLEGLGRRTSVFERLEGILRKDWRTADEVLEQIGWKPEPEDVPESVE
jgi:DNA sulfur modification protein DndC